MKIYYLNIFYGGWSSYQPKVLANSPDTGEFADTFGSQQVQLKSIPGQKSKKLLQQK